MSVEKYAKAKRMGMKAFREAAARGESPYVSILDEILKQEGQSGETRIGTYEVPLSLVVGTRTRSRAESFACNFMPILSERSEFALKWQQLYESQLEEGIRDPIRVYEYKNRFYVQEGNKRTSVMKFVESPGILADVTRILPRFESEKQESLYREYADFNRVTGLFHILFTKPGSYGRLAAYFREGLKDPWKTEDLEDLRSAYHRFADCYTAQKPETEAMGDAFLTYLGIFGRETLLLGQLDQIRSNIDKAKDELELSQKDHKVALIEAPGQGKEAHREKKSLFEILFARGSEERRINIAFINELAKIFNAMGIDTHDVLEAAATKWNFIHLSPGLVGGHCISVDPYYLIQRAQVYGVLPRIMFSARRLNDGMGDYVANQTIKAMNLKGLRVKDARILILGFTFKENCPDIRNTKVVDIYHTLREYTGNLVVYDPWADGNAVREAYGIDIRCSGIENLHGSFDAVILAVAHREFLLMDARRFLDKPEEGVVYDVKGCLPRTSVDARL